MISNWKDQIVKAKYTVQEAGRLGEQKKINVREELTKMIVQRAQADDEFRKLLLEEPKKAFEKVGLRVPEHVDLREVEETGNVCYVELNAMPKGKEEA